MAAPNSAAGSCRKRVSVIARMLPEYVLPGRPATAASSRGGSHAITAPEYTPRCDVRLTSTSSLRTRRVSASVPSSRT
jgi:hypothetical protein